MRYLLDFGFVDREEEVNEYESRLLAEINNPRLDPWEYNNDLDIRNHIHCLNVFATKKRSYAEWCNEAMYDRQRGEGYEGSIGRVLHRTFNPLQNRDKILRRQALIRRFVEGDEGLVTLTKDILLIHNRLRTSTYGDEYNRMPVGDATKFFAALARKFREFRDRYKGDDLLGSFANEMNDFLTKTIRKSERFFENGINLVAEGDNFYLMPSRPEGKGVFDLGLFQQGKDTKLRCYPRQEEDLVDIKKFTGSSSAFIYTLGSFFYQAEVYKRRKKLGLPVCIPNINEDGRFVIRNAYPVTTYLRTKGDLFSFEYDKDRRKFLFGGAHSGGKSELIKNIGGYHIIGLGGGILFCDEGAEVPVTRRVITSFRKSQESKKGALESEVKEALRLDRDAMAGDLLLIDEFLDTTKPELAMHIASPILKGETRLCRGLANSPGTVLIVDHRASRMDENYGFDFMAPKLERVKAKDLAKRLEGRGGYYDDAYELEQQGDVEILVPTHDFVAGKPDKDEVRAHALEMWERVKHDVEDERRGGRDMYGYERYGIGVEEEERVISMEEEERQAVIRRKQAKQEEKTWEDFKEPEPLPEPEPEPVKKQEIFYDEDDLPF